MTAPLYQFLTPSLLPCSIVVRLDPHARTYTLIIRQTVAAVPLKQPCPRVTSLCLIMSEDVQVICRLCSIFRVQLPAQGNAGRVDHHRHAMASAFDWLGLQQLYPYVGLFSIATWLACPPGLGHMYLPGDGKGKWLGAGPGGSDPQTPSIVEHSDVGVVVSRKRHKRRQGSTAARSCLPQPERAARQRDCWQKSISVTAQSPLRADRPATEQRLDSASATQM